jgi:hypothetical protein
MTLTIWTEVQLQWAVRNDVKYGDTDNTRIGAKISQVLCETYAKLQPSTKVSYSHYSHIQLYSIIFNIQSYQNASAFSIQVLFA